MSALPVGLVSKSQVELDPFDVATDNAYRNALKAVTAILEALPDTITDADVEHAVIDRRFKVPIDTAPLLAIATDELQPVTRSVYARAGQDQIDNATVKGRKDTIADLADDAGITLSFTINNPRAERWASRFAGALVTEITRAQQRAIRALILRALQEGGGARQVARQIRQFVGLHSRYATAVMNYRQRLVASGMLASRIDQLTDAKYASLLKARAENIARTEILSAANAGRAEAWQQAYRAGLFGTTVPRKEWSAASGAEQVCADMDGTSVLLYDMFTTALGDFDMPPAHPSCRCTAVIVTDETAGRVPKPGSSRSGAPSLPTVPKPPPIPKPTPPPVLPKPAMPSVPKPAPSIPTTSTPVADAPITRAPTFQSTDDAVKWINDNIAPLEDTALNKSHLKGLQRLADTLVERKATLKLSGIRFSPKGMNRQAHASMAHPFGSPVSRMDVRRTALTDRYWTDHIGRAERYLAKNGSTFTYADRYAPGTMDRLASVIDHELAHGVYYQLGTDMQNAWTTVWHAGRTAADNPIGLNSVYGLHNSSEGFAECFSAYLNGHAELLPRVVVEWIEANMGAFL